MRTRLIVGLLVPFTIVGCVRIPRENHGINRYSIDRPPVNSPAGVASELTLLVFPFESSAGLKSDRVMHRNAAYDLNPYFYHRWVGTPAKLVTDALIDYLLETNLCGDRVIRAEFGVVPTHEIHGRLERLHVERNGTEQSAAFGVSLTVVRVGANGKPRNVVFQKRYDADLPCPEATVESFVATANLAVGAWLEEVRADLERRLLEEDAE